MQRLIGYTEDESLGIALIQTDIGEDLFIVKKENIGLGWSHNNLEIVKFLDNKFIYNNKYKIKMYTNPAGDFNDAIFTMKSLIFLTKFKMFYKFNWSK